MKGVRYPRLYLRMALYIGSALTAFVLLGALAFAAIAAWELTGYLETRNSHIGREAAAIVAEGGLPALEEWIRTRKDIPGDADVYVFDEAGNDILGRPIPGIYREFVQTALAAGREAETGNFRPVRLTAQVVTDDGAIYSFLIVPRNITLFGGVATAVGLFFVALAVIATVAWLIAGRIGKPIGELQQAVRNLAAGDITARVPDSITERRDELGQLADDFNSMAADLQQLIDGRERLMRELSHELRSPLTRLQAALTLATSRNSLQPDERQRIENEIDRMNRVIGELLRYSALDSSVSMQIRLVRIDRLLAKLVDVETIEADTAGCRLQLDTDHNLEVAGDPELLTRALENLVRNAIRYAPSGTAVEINASRKNGFIVVQVRDHGPGVASGKLEQIFEPYVRADTATQGTGLGLAIVRRVVTRHGGTVSAANAPGGGLVVSVRIPAAEFS